MAQEITATGNVQINSQGQSGQGAFNFQADIGAEGFIAEEITVDTSDTPVTLPTGATTVLVVNLDGTNFVEVDSANTYDKFPQKLLPGSDGNPGRGVILCPETGTIHLKADTAACQVFIIAG